MTKLSKVYCRTSNRVWYFAMLFTLLSATVVFNLPPSFVSAEDPSPPSWEPCGNGGKCISGWADNCGSKAHKTALKAAKTNANAACTDECKELLRDLVGPEDVVKGVADLSGCTDSGHSHGVGSSCKFEVEITCGEGKGTCHCEVIDNAAQGSIDVSEPESFLDPVNK
ncbi:MAG: hypothetical protein KDD53_05445 [Bdellovibrionales bacterium]|nr:hypothetical protein [Bdellovibrionales bacterium]